MKTRVRVDGLRDLDQALGELKLTTAKGVLRRVGRKALEPFDANWRGKVHRLTGKLAESGGIGAKLSRRQRAQHTREMMVEVFAGPGPDAAAVQDEFGNSRQAPIPAVRPAWDETKDGALETVKTELGGEIRKTAERAARRTARLAKKGA